MISAILCGGAGAGLWPLSRELHPQAFLGQPSGRSLLEEAYLLHRRVYRPWGSYTLLGQGSRFKIKRLEIKPGASISLQRHCHRNEHWIVVSGLAEVTRDDEVFLVDTNESTYIKAGCKHRVTNLGLIDLVIIEVQSGDYLGEDDIVRFEDVYGRLEPQGIKRPA